MLAVSDTMTTVGFQIKVVILAPFAWNFKNRSAVNDFGFRQRRQLLTTFVEMTP